MNGSRTDAIVTSAFLWSALPTPEQSAMTDNTEDRGPQDRFRIHRLISSTNTENAIAA